MKAVFFEVLDNANVPAGGKQVKEQGLYSPSPGRRDSLLLVNKVWVRNAFFPSSFFFLNLHQELQQQI